MPSGSELTAAMRDQFEAHRRRMQHKLAHLVLDIVGVHDVNGQRYVASADLRAHDDELAGLLGQVRAYFTADERARLYTSKSRVGVCAAKLVLRATGHPLKRMRRGNGNWFTLA